MTGRSKRQLQRLVRRFRTVVRPYGDHRRYDIKALVSYRVSIMMTTF